MANRGDYFKCLSYTRYIDQMVLYAAIRKGRADYGDNSLDNIVNIELGYNKRPWDDPETNVINAAIREYENFVLYNIQDVWLQVKLNRKIGDIDTMFAQSFDGGTRIYKTLKQSIYLKNVFAMAYEEMGYIPGNNCNIDYINLDTKSDGDDGVDDIDTEFLEKLAGALVGDPENNVANGTVIFGRASKYCYQNVIDYDYASEYPKIKIMNNIAPSTQIGRLRIHKQVSPLENPMNDEKYKRGGDFVNDFECQDLWNLGYKWFGLKHFSDYAKKFGKKHKKRKKGCA